MAGYDAIAGRPKPVLNEEIEFIEAARIEQELDSLPGSEFSLSMHFGYLFFAAPKGGSRFNVTKFRDDIPHVRVRLRLHFSRALLCDVLQLVQKTACLAAKQPNSRMMGTRSGIFKRTASSIRFSFC
jgi:hypothetical protein